MNEKNEKIIEWQNIFGSHVLNKTRFLAHWETESFTTEILAM